MAKDMSGSLAKNDRKEQENHPDIKGSCMIDGTEYWISGWAKENERGKWYSLSFKAKEAAQPQPTKAAPKKSVADIDDDLPF